MDKISIQNVMAISSISKEEIIIQWFCDSEFKEISLYKKFDTTEPWKASTDFKREELKKALCQFVDDIIVN